MSSRKTRLLIALALPMVLLAGACASTVGTQAGGEGVPENTSKQDYIKAFADINTIELTTQTATGKGTTAAKYYEDYSQALDEWSGGKLKLKIGYGNSIVPPDEAATALSDGRLSFGQAFPVYEPSKYPAYADFADSTFLGNQSPIAGSLETTAAFLEAGLAREEVMKSMEPEGVKILLPYGPQTSNGLLCKTPRNTAEELKGAQVRVSTSAISDQAKALGMSPTSLPYSEVYEAIQRGTIDCLIGQDFAFDALGVTPLAPNYTLSGNVGFARTPFVFGVNKRTWDNLPLVARQLIWDRLDVFMKSNFSEHIIPNSILAQKNMLENGGSIQPFSSDVESKLSAKNADLLEKIRKSTSIDGEQYVSDLNSSLSAWSSLVAELGYSNKSGKDLISDPSTGEVDITPFIDEISRKVLAPHRPN